MIDYSVTDDGKVQGDGTASEHVEGLLFTPNFYIHSSFRKPTFLLPTF